MSVCSTHAEIKTAAFSFVDVSQENLWRSRLRKTFQIQIVQNYGSLITKMDLSLYLCFCNPLHPFTDRDEKSEEKKMLLQMEHFQVYLKKS